jgi:hypothetical protein
MYICLGEPQVNQNESHLHGFFVIFTVSTGTLDASGTACMDGIGCWDELTGNSSCIVVGAKGIDTQCGNTDLINEAIKDTEQYWDDIEQAADDAADDVEKAADDAWKEVNKWF